MVCFAASVPASPSPHPSPLNTMLRCEPSQRLHARATSLLHARAATRAHHRPTRTTKGFNFVFREEGCGEGGTLPFTGKEF